MTRKDAGVYTVKCTNEEGVSETTVLLDVQCKKLHVFTSVMWTPVESACESDAAGRVQHENDIHSN